MKGNKSSVRVEAWFSYMVSKWFFLVLTNFLFQINLKKQELIGLKNLIENEKKDSSNS